jgi:Flp pilus assembly protein TadD
MRRQRLVVILSALSICACATGPAGKPGDEGAAGGKAETTTMTSIEAAVPVNASSGAAPTATAAAPEATSSTSEAVPAAAPAAAQSIGGTGTEAVFEAGAETRPELGEEYAAASPECREVLLVALAHAVEGRWSSAFEALNAFDPDDADPYALAMKTSIAISGFAQSARHLAFGFKDLEEGEDLETLRASGIEYGLTELDPPAMADAQEKAGKTSPPVLSKALGDYYYDVYSRFEGQWLLGDEEIGSRSVANYERALSAGLFDRDSLMNHAEMLMRISRAAESEPLYRRVLEIEPGNPTASYNLAMSYFLSDRKAEGLDQLDAAIGLIPQPEQRFEAIAVGARTAMEFGDDGRYESYLARADEEFPENPSPLMLRHALSIERGDDEAADRAADALMDKWASDPTIVRAIVSSWYNAGEADAAYAFLRRSIEGTTDDMEIGTLQFYLAVLLVQDETGEEAKAKAVALLDEAEAHMSKVFDPEEQVFAVIDMIRRQILGQAEEEGEAGSAEEPESIADEGGIDAESGATASGEEATTSTGSPTSP